MTEVSLFSQPGMLPGPCCFPTVLVLPFLSPGRAVASAGSLVALVLPKGSWWHSSSPRAPVLNHPSESRISTAGHWGIRAHPIAGAHPLCLGVQIVAKGHRELLVPVLGAAPGSPSLCCCCCCCLFHLPCLFLPWSSSLPVPVIRWHPQLCVAQPLAGV